MGTNSAKGKCGGWIIRAFVRAARASGRARQNFASRRAVDLLWRFCGGPVYKPWREIATALFHVEPGRRASGPRSKAGVFHVKPSEKHGKMHVKKGYNKNDKKYNHSTFI